MLREFIHKMKLKNAGPLYVLVAAILWSTAGVGIKYIPWSPLSIASMRGVVAAFTFMIVIASFSKREGTAKISIREWKASLTRSTIMAALCLQCTMLLFITANHFTTAANAAVLQYTAPVYVMILMFIVQKVKPKPLEIVTIIVTFLGITLFFLDYLGEGAMLGNLAGMLSGVTFAGVFYFNSLPDSNPARASFMAFSMSALLLPAMFFDPAVSAGGVVPWIVVILLGVFQLGLAYFIFAKGIRSTGAVSASIICMTEPILSPIWVVMIIGEYPGPFALVGGVLVIGVVAAYNIINARVHKTG